LESDRIGEEEMELRKNTYTGRPAGSRAFMEWAESSHRTKSKGATKWPSPKQRGSGNESRWTSRIIRCGIIGTRGLSPVFPLRFSRTGS
jgi:hypothetical protein